eukprot:g76784.t1
MGICASKGGDQGPKREKTGLDLGKELGDEVDAADENKAKAKSEGGLVFDLSKFPGNKIWQLSEVERKQLWDSLDKNGDGKLQKSELNTLAAEWWQEQKRRGDTRAEFWDDFDAEHHTKVIREAFAGDVDVDRDGFVERDEFINKWNEEAEKAFKESSHCVIL